MINNILNIVVGIIVGIVVVGIIICSAKRDAKLMQVYENVEPCMVDSRLPACE